MPIYVQYESNKTMDKDSSCTLRKMLMSTRLSVMNVMKSDHLSESQCLGRAKRVEQINRKTTSLWEPACKLGQAKLVGSVKLTREKPTVDVPLMELSQNLMEKEKLRIKLERFKESDIKLDLSRIGDKSETSTPLSTKRTLRQTKKKTSAFKPGCQRNLLKSEILNDKQN